MEPLLTLELDGSPPANHHADLRPIDVDGDGKYEFLHWNGFRSMQVWAADGRKLWRVANPEGRTNEYEQGVRRDTAAILDLDGDGKQDIAHCWRQGNERHLVYRRGLDGKVIRGARLGGGDGAACRVAAFRMAATRQTLVLVAAERAGEPGCRRGRPAGKRAGTVAFDLRGRRAWGAAACGARPLAYHPLDVDADGWAEGVFAGRELLHPTARSGARSAVGPPVRSSKP